MHSRVDDRYFNQSSIVQKVVTMAALASMFVLLSIVILMLIQSTASSADASTKTTCNDLCDNLVETSATLIGRRGGGGSTAAATIANTKSPTTRGKIRDDKARAAAAAGGSTTATHLSDNEELLMGYDLLANLFTSQSTLWFSPSMRRLTFGSPLLRETKIVMKIMSQKGRQRSKELKKLRQLHPHVTKKFIDPHPSKLVEAIGKNMAWKVVKDLTNRGPEFDLDFGVAQMAINRIISSTALGILEFETNEERKKWLQEVANEHKQVRTEFTNY